MFEGKFAFRLKWHVRSTRRSRLIQVDYRSTSSLLQPTEWFMWDSRSILCTVGFFGTHLPVFVCRKHVALLLKRHYWSLYQKMIGWSCLWFVSGVRQRGSGHLISDTNSRDQSNGWKQPKVHYITRIFYAVFTDLMSRFTLESPFSCALSCWRRSNLLGLFT